MALTLTLVHQSTSSNAFGTGAYTAASFTPTASRRLLVVAQMQESSDSGAEGSNLTVSCSTGGVTSLTVVGTSPNAPAGWSYGSRAWISDQSTSGSAVTDLAVDCGAASIENYRLTVWEVLDFGSIGATATGTSATGDGALALTLGAAPASSSVCVAILNLSLTGNPFPAVTPNAAWTEVEEVGRDDWWVYQIQRRASSTSTSVDWDDINTLGTPSAGAVAFAFEVVEGGGGATVTGQTVTVTVSTIAGSVTTPDATVNGQTLTIGASLIKQAVEQFIPEDLFIFGDTDSNESSMGGQKLFGGYPASGSVDATVNGQTITVNGSVIAGSASGASNATVTGQTITVNGSVIAGTASADSSVAGQTITVNASVIPGSATGTGDASVTGQTITVNGSVIAGSATGSSNATVNGQTVAVTASLIAGAVTGDSSVAGQTLTVAASLIAGGVAADSEAAGTVINIAASVIAGSASAPTNATVNGQTITINGSIIPGAAFGPSAGGQRWRSIGMHLGLRL